RSDKPFKLRKPASHSDHSFKSGKPSHFDKPFKPDRSSDKSFKSRERSTSREDRREPRSDNTGAKSFKSGKNFSGKEAKPCDSRKRNSREK
ncbi:MAG: RNA methyltransferase, partial [Bacteroidales bacterium]|nr:RNA methyltransferase [Bacteroidales bacterium]